MPAALRKQAHMSDAAPELPQPRTWPALLWTAAGITALFASQFLGLLAFVIWARLQHPDKPVSFHGNIHNGLAVSVAVIVSTLVVTPILWGFARIRTRAVAHYFGLRWPRFKDFLIGLIGLVLIFAVLAAFARVLNDPRAMAFAQETFISARAQHVLWLLVFSVIVAGPLGEEIVFRGFLYKTIELRFGPVIAIVLTSVGWAALHIQYGIISMIPLVAIGIVLGTLRYRSHSLPLTMLLHSLWNGVAMLGAAALTAAH